MIDERKNVQATRTYCKHSRPLPYYNPNCRTPRHWCLPRTIALPDHPVTLVSLIFMTINLFIYWTAHIDRKVFLWLPFWQFYPQNLIWIQVVLVLFPFGQVVLARVVLARFPGWVVSAQLGQGVSAQFQKWVVSAQFKGWVVSAWFIYFGNACKFSGWVHPDSALIKLSKFMYYIS